MSICKLEASTVANVSIQDAWTMLSDLSNAHMYVPNLTGTKIVTTQKTGVGTRRVVYSRHTPLNETVTHWQKGVGIKLRLHNENGEGIPPLFKTGRFEYNLESVGEDATRLTNIMRVEPKWGWLGDLITRFLKKSMQDIHNRITYGQRLFYETGIKPRRTDVIELILKEKSTNE